jgi:hypothetical protein
MPSGVRLAKERDVAHRPGTGWAVIGSRIVSQAERGARLHYLT